jgi:CDP-glycerol glycerophosphotransferase (TagB/SpsB family)
VRRGLAWARVALVRAGFAVGRLLPVRRRVVLATAHADRLDGNLADIRRGLARRAPGADVVVLASRVRPGPGGALVAAADAVRAGWHLARASLVVLDDYWFPLYAIRPRGGTRHIQVWHACGAFKRFGRSVADRGFGADAATRATVAIHSNYDLCLVSASRFAPFYAEAFGLPLDRFTARLGIPRTDLFFDAPRRAAAEAAVRARYGLSEARRTVLYAPTFRGERITEATSPTELDLGALAAALGDDHVLLVRAHPFVTARLRGPATEAGLPADDDARVVDVSDWPEMNEVLLVADVLVTDYSSAIYEFALLGRPIGFFAPDQAAYVAERGFYLDWPADLPGPVFEHAGDLATWLRTGAYDLERIRAFAAAAFDVADGGATDRLLDAEVLPALS